MLRAMICLPLGVQQRGPVRLKTGTRSVPMLLAPGRLAEAGGEAVLLGVGEVLERLLLDVAPQPQPMTAPSTPGWCRTYDMRSPQARRPITPGATRRHPPRSAGAALSSGVKARTRLRFWGSRRTSPQCERRPAPRVGSGAPFASGPG